MFRTRRLLSCALRGSFRVVAAYALLLVVRLDSYGFETKDFEYRRVMLCSVDENITMYLVRRIVNARPLFVSECVEIPYIESEALEIVKDRIVRRINLQYLRCLPVLSSSGDSLHVLQVKLTTIGILKDSSGAVLGFRATFGGSDRFRSSYCPNGYVVLDVSGNEIYAWVGVEARVGLEGRTFILRGNKEKYESLNDRNGLRVEKCWIAP